MPKAADKQRAVLEERHRVEATLAVIEAAKRKALAQREEYGKFLEWKVKMQRREREQREEEERTLRERIDKKLKEVLEEHRERKRQETERWKQFATTTVSPMKETTMQMAARLQKEAADEQRARDKADKRQWVVDRLKAVPRTAPARRGDDQQQQQQRDGEANAKAGYEATVPRRGAPPAVAGRRGSTAPNNNEDENNNDDDNFVFMTEAELAAKYQLPNFSVTRKGFGEEALTVAQKQELALVDTRKRVTHRKAQQVKDMYDAAVSRRHYSTARMLADPPADMLIAADLMRYIPADVLGTLDDASAPKPPASPRTDAQTFFLTEDTRSGGGVVMATSSDLLADPGERHLDGDQHSPRPPKGARGAANANGTNSRVSRWSTYDPHAWLNAGTRDAELPDPASLRPRNSDEERATLQWYKECYEPLTKIKKRTDRFKAHSWSGVAKHKLPPLASARFDEQQ